jgi:hypothetical protein
VGDICARLWILAGLHYHSHQVSGCPNPPFDAWHPVIFNRLADSSHHALFRKVVDDPLSHEEVSISHPNHADPRALVNVVNHHVAHIASNIEVLEIIKNGFPLRPNSNIAAHLSDVVHISLQCLPRLKHHVLCAFRGR